SSCQAPATPATYTPSLHDALPILQRTELEAARDAGIDALVTVYHADHRELCAHERDWPFQVVNALEIVGASMGLHHDDQYKRLRSEEHTSELQSLRHLVCRLLLEK